MGTLRPPYQQKYFFRPIGAFFLLKLKVTKIPIQNGPFLAPWEALFSALEAIETKATTFLNARDHDWLHGMNDFVSIALEKKSMFSTESFSSVPPYLFCLLSQAAVSCERVQVGR